jgi:hypothetical protein
LPRRKTRGFGANGGGNAAPAFKFLIQRVSENEG